MLEMYHCDNHFVLHLHNQRKQNNQALSIQRYYSSSYAPLHILNWTEHHVPRCITLQQKLSYFHHFCQTTLRFFPTASASLLCQHSSPTVLTAFPKFIRRCIWQEDYFSPMKTSVKPIFRRRKEKKKIHQVSVCFHPIQVLILVPLKIQHRPA